LGAAMMGAGILPPLGPDLYVVKYWKLEEFIATMRTGVDPNGHKLSEQMPWRPMDARMMSNCRRSMNILIVFRVLEYLCLHAAVNVARL
jgi:hypothetical protein